MFSETFLTLIWRDRMLLLEFVVPAANPDRPAAGVRGRIANCKKFLELKMLRGKKQQNKKEKKKTSGEKKCNHKKQVQKKSLLPEFPAVNTSLNNIFMNAAHLYSISSNASAAEFCA